MFTLRGFPGVRREGIELTAGFTAAVNVELQVGTVEETVPEAQSLRRLTRQPR